MRNIPNFLIIAFLFFQIQGKSFAYGYQVNEPKSGSFYRKEESSDGDKTVSAISNFQIWTSGLLKKFQSFTKCHDHRQSISSDCAGVKI